jgi:exonuclease III
MIVLSFNARGVGGTPKSLALKQLCVVVNPDIIMVQETMRSRTKLEEIFSSWLKGWFFCSTYAEGFSRGLITACSPKLKVIDSQGYPSCIIVQVKDRMLNSSLKICNVYGPYANRIPFCDHLSTLDFLNSGNIILGGDLNFTVSLK